MTAFGRSPCQFIDTRITCQEVVEVVTNYLEGRMSPEDVAILEAHLDLCEGCTWYVEQMRITIATVGRIEEADVPDEMRDTLTTAFRGRTRSSRPSPTGPRGRWRRWPGSRGA